MKITVDNTVGDIIAMNADAANIFEEYDIEVCTNINVPLKEVLDHNFAPQKQRERFLNALENNQRSEQEKSAENYEAWPLDELAAHIENIHHTYIEEKIPIIKQYLGRIEMVHGKNHPELKEVNQIFKTSSGALAMHLKREELMLFPFIKKMAKAQKEKEAIAQPRFGSIKNPITQMDEDHEDEEAVFEKIRKLTNNYTLPKDGCGSYAIAFAMLKEFEEDLHLHIHKENNILFKKAIALEAELIESKLITL